MPSGRVKAWLAPAFGASGAILAGIASAEAAASPVSCGGAAMLGGAQLLCSHVDAKAPAQLCTFSWALVTTSNVTRIVDGSFLLPPAAQNVQVYQGSGFSSQASQPIVMCQGRRVPK